MKCILKNIHSKFATHRAATQFIFINSKRGGGSGSGRGRGRGREGDWGAAEFDLGLKLEKWLELLLPNIDQSKYFSSMFFSTWLRITRKAEDTTIEMALVPIPLLAYIYYSNSSTNIALLLFKPQKVSPLWQDVIQLFPLQKTFSIINRAFHNVGF